MASAVLLSISPKPPSPAPLSGCLSGRPAAPSDPDCQAADQRWAKSAPRCRCRIDIIVIAAACLSSRKPCALRTRRLALPFRHKRHQVERAPPPAGSSARQRPPCVCGPARPSPPTRPVPRTRRSAPSTKRRAGPPCVRSPAPCSPRPNARRPVRRAAGRPARACPAARRPVLLQTADRPRSGQKLARHFERWARWRRGRTACSRGGTSRPR